MITGVELRNIAEQAYNDGVGGYDPWYDAIAAVVRALEPSLEQWFFNIGSSGRTVTSPETAIWANEFIKSILGDALTGDDGDDSKATGCDMSVGDILPTSPASFCEWRVSENRQEYTRGCSREIISDQYGIHRQCQNCPSCGKQIKFMADASTRKDEEATGVKSSLTLSTTSAATVDEDTIIEFVRDWDYSGYPFDLNFARKLKQKLLEAEYKILSREPTKEMVDAVTVSPSERIRDIVKRDWRKQWDAAK